MRPRPRPLLSRLRNAARRAGRRLHHDEDGATMLEWTMLVAAIALPAYVIVRVGLSLLVTHYRLVTTLNGLPFP